MLVVTDFVGKNFSTNLDFKLPENIGKVGIQLENGRVIVYVDEVEIYNNLSLHDGFIDIDKE